jgi:dTDP-glucose pyrophosphorylase
MSISEKVWRNLILAKNATIKQAIDKLNESGLQIVLILDKNDILLGTISDGDIRRGLLRGLDLSDIVERVMNGKALVVPPDLSRDMVLHIMRTNRIRQIPIIEVNHKVMGLHLWEDITAPTELPNLMVIMAGGLGTRLRPYTENCPKPMLQVAGKPMLEHIIERAKNEGLFNFIISVQYLGSMIEDYFGNGSKFGVNIDYLKESQPLGTAGALGILAPRPKLPFIVTNGDVLSDIRYTELLDFHVRNDAVATMAVRLYEWQHPFGVVKMEGADIVDFEEKPITRTHVNAGIYVLSPDALNKMSKNTYCDMPILFQRLKEGGSRTVAYPMHEPWLDVGRPADLERASKLHAQAK